MNETMTLEMTWAKLKDIMAECPPDSYAFIVDEIKETVDFINQANAIQLAPKWTVEVGSIRTGTEYAGWVRARSHKEALERASYFFGNDYGLSVELENEKTEEPSYDGEISLVDCEDGYGRCSW